MLRDAEGRPISLEGLSGISYRKGAEAPEPPEPLDPEAPKPLKKVPPNRGLLFSLEGLSSYAPDPGEPVSTPAPREEGVVELHPLQKLEETPEKTDTEEDPYSVNEFLYDAGQTALFFGKLPAIKAGVLWGVAEPSVQKYHFASALEEDDGYYAGARGNITRTLRSAFRRWKEKNPDADQDEDMWVLSHQENLNPAFSRYTKEDVNLEGYARARLNDPKRPFMEWIKQGPGSARAYVRGYRAMLEPYGELTREEMKGLRQSQADLDEFTAPFLVDPFEQTLFEFKRSIREGENKGRGELLFNNFLELNQATWHLLKQIVAGVPDKEYNQLIRQGDLPLTFMNWTGPIGDVIASGVGIGKNLGYGLRGMLKTFSDDPLGMIKARPMDAAMLAYMAFTIARGSKNPALLKKLAEESPRASALMGIAKGAAEKRGLFKEATLGGKPFLKYQRQILAGLASLHKKKKPLKASDFKIKEKLLEKRTYADVYASMLSAVTHGMIAGVPDIGLVVGLLKNMHSRGLNNAGWESFSRFMAVNFLNYYRQLTPEQEAIARRIARDAVEGGQSVKEVVSKLENYIRESDAVQEGGRETQTKKETPASPTEATVDIETGQITKTKDLYEETLQRAAERAARPEGVDVNDFVQREVDGVLKFERPMRVTQVVKSDKGIFVKVEGSEGYFPIKEVIRAEPPEGAVVPPMQTGARKTKAQEATEAEVAPEPLAPEQIEKIAPEVEAVPSEGKVQVRLTSDGRMIAVPDLDGMTLPELRRYATENKIPGRSRKKKAPLLELIKKFLSEEKGTVRALDAAAVGLVDALIKGVEGVTGQMEVLVRRYTQESNPLVRDAIAAKLSDLTESAIRANIPRSEIDEAIERGGVVTVEGGGYTVRGDAAERAYQRVLREDVESLGVLSEASPRSLFEGLNDNQRRRLARRGIDTDADFANLSSSDQRRIAVDELIIERNRLQRDHVIDLLKKDGIIGKKAHRSHPTLEAELSESGGIIPKGQGASKGILAQRLATKGITPKDQRIPGDPAVVTAPTEKIPTRYYESPGAPKLSRAEREQLGADFEVKPTPVAVSAATPRATIGAGKPTPKREGIDRVISGGQIGADRLGLEVARELGIKTGGTAPKGFRTATGKDWSLKNKFNLTESESPGYKLRTERNVIDGDATLVFAENVNSAGTRLTREYAKKHKKPYIENPTPKEFAEFVEANNIRTLNIAGNRVYKNRKQIKDVLSAGLKARPKKPEALPRAIKVPGTKPFTPRPKKRVVRSKWITKDKMDAASDNTVFLFGDNLEGKGRGGQARVMRGHPKAVGIPTKKKPKTTEDSYFTDAEFEANARAITAAFAKIPEDATVVIPSAGLGTGLAQLQARAPRTLEFINNKIRALEKKKPIVAKVRREGEVIRTSPEGVKAHSKAMRDAANRDKAASRLAAQGLDINGVIAAVKELVEGAKKKEPVRESAYVRMIEEAHDIHGAHNIYEAAVKDYDAPVPKKVMKAYALKLSETYGPNADIPFLRENLKDLLTEKEIATLDANAKEMGLSYLDISKPAKHLTDIQAESLAAEINRRASLDLSPKEMKPLAEEFRRDIPPASSANIIPGTPKAIEIKLEAVENSNLPPAKKKAARQELVREETEMHLGGAAVEAGTRPNGTNPTYDMSPQAVAFKITMPRVVPGKKQGYKVWTLKVGGKPGMLISSMKNEIKDIVKKLGIVQDRGSGPRVFGALKALEDAAAFGWSVMASDRLRNAIARNAVDQVFSVAEMEKGPFSGNKMKYFRLLKEANDYLNQFQVPLIAPVELQGSTVAKVPGIIKLGNKDVNLYKIALDTIAKEVTSPQIAKEISADAVKVIGETIAAEAGRAGFYKGQFNFVLDYFFDTNLEDFRQKVDRKASPLGYGEVDWNRVITLLETLTDNNASMANKILEKRILDNRAMPSVLPGNVDAAGLVSFMLDASNRAPIIREFNKTFRERTGRSMTPAEAKAIMRIVRAEAPRLKRHTLLGEDLRVGFSAIREGGKWKRTKGRADYQEAVVNSFSRAVDGAFKTADEVYWRNLPEAWRFKLDPGFNSSYGWVHQKFIKRGFFERMVLNSKGKMTVWNLPTQKGNYFSNIGLISLYLGNTPMDAMAQTIVTSVEAAKHERLRKTGASKKEFESGPVKIDAVSRRFYDQLPTLEIKTSDLAVAELNRLKELDTMNEVFSDIGNPVLSTFGDYIKDFKLNWATKPASNWLRSLGVGARKAYSYGDASGKLALARSAFKSMDKEMSEMVGGDIYHLEQSMASTIEITKNKDGYYYHGKRRLSQQQLDRYMAVAAERQANRLIPNYLQDVGAVIPILRGNILTGPFSWFPTWSYKMTPLPGKKGILTAVFLDDTTYGPVSNPKAFMKHQGVRAARVLRQIAYQNSLKGIAGDVDILNAQVNERGPGTFSLGETVVVDDDEYGYAWVSSARNMNALNPGMTALLMLLRSAGLASKTLWSALGLKAPEQTQRLNKAFTSGFLTVGKEELAQLAGLGGNLIVENIMSMTGAKQFGYRAPRGVDYFNKLGAAVIGGTPAQLLDGLLAHAGTESPLFMLSRYQFASPYGDGDQGAAVPVSRMMVQRLFGGFRKVNLIQADMKFIKKFTARLQEEVSALEDHIEIMYRDGKADEARAVEHQLMEVRDEISRQVLILQDRRARSGKYLNVGSFD